MPHTAPAIKRDFFTVRQAAKESGYAERTILKYISTGVIKAELLEPERPGSGWIMHKSEVERLKRERPRED